MNTILKPYDTSAHTPAATGLEYPEGAGVSFRQAAAFPRRYPLRAEYHRPACSMGRKRTAKASRGQQSVSSRKEQTNGYVLYTRWVQKPRQGQPAGTDNL